MLAIERPAGVAPEANLRNHERMRKHERNKSTLALKLKADITTLLEVQNMGISGPKKVLYPPKLKKKQLYIIANQASETPDIRFCIVSGWSGIYNWSPDLCSRPRNFCYVTDDNLLMIPL